MNIPSRYILFLGVVLSLTFLHFSSLLIGSVQAITSQPGYSASCGGYRNDDFVHCYIPGTRWVLPDALACPGAFPSCCKHIEDCPKTWTCNDGGRCVHGSIGGGQFATQAECLTSCAPPASTSVRCEGSETSIATPLGCIPFENLNTFSSFILRWALGVAGGLSTLGIIWGAFIYMTSGGDPKRVLTGKQVITSAIAGLVLIILSVFVLDVFGIQILDLPAFQ